MNCRLEGHLCAISGVVRSILYTNSLLFIQFKLQITYLAHPQIFLRSWS